MRSFGLLCAALPDPRASNARHDLSEILFIAFAAVLCGAQSCQEMADFGVAKAISLRRFLRLRHGIPSHDTFSRLFRLLDPVAFEAVFRRFTAAYAEWLSGQVGTAGHVIAIDGKTLRAAFDAGTGATPLQMVTAWSTHHRLVLAQRQSPGGNEVAAALAVVGLLDLEATTVTADALHGNRKMAEAIRARGGDYVLAVKANQSSLFAYVKAFLTRAPRRKQSAIELACERGTMPPVSSHGRREQRRTIVMTLPEGTAQRFKFAGLTAPSPGSTQPGASASTSSGKVAISCFHESSPQHKSSPRCAPIGASRTSSTGFSMPS